MMPTIAEMVLAAFVILQGLDYASTRKALTSGRGYEKNPILRPVIEAIGLDPALILKTVLAGVVGLWLFHSDALWGLVALDAFYFAVVINNLRVLRG